MLEVKDLYVPYGMMEVIYGVNLKVDSGELVLVIGPNGTGKAALIETTMGLVPLHSGSILYDGRDIPVLPTHKRAEMGIGYVPEGRRVFGDLTVEGSPRIGTYRLPDTKQIRPNLQKIYEMFPRLGERKDRLAHTMSGGGQQILTIGHAPMLFPRLLLVGEVSMELMPVMVNTCFQITKELNESGITILMVEQSASKALKIVNRKYVIEAGNVTLEGTSEILRSNDMVQKAYLGS